MYFDIYNFPKRLFHTRTLRPSYSRTLAFKDVDGTSLPISTPTKKEEQHAVILKEFLETFKDMTMITTFDQLMNLVNLNKEVRKWYIAYKTEFTTEISMPDWLKPLKGARDKWKRIEEQRIMLGSKERSWSERETKAAESLKRELDGIRKEREEVYKSLDKLTLIERVTVNELPRDRALRVALASTPELRKEVSKKEVDGFKVDLYKRMESGAEWVDPFA